MRKALFVSLLIALLSFFSQAQSKKKGSSTPQGKPKTLVSIKVTPANQIKNVGDSVIYKAVGKYSDGTSKNLTTTATWNSSLPSVAMLTASVGTCEGKGNTSISAALSGITGATSLQCNVIVGNDMYCKPGDVPILPASDGPAQLPESCFYTNPSRVVTPGITRTITSDDDWDSVWSSTNCGDIVRIQSGATLVKKHVIPSRACDDQHWIKVSVTSFASLPAYGTRITPCYAGVASLPGRPDFHCLNTTNVMAKLVQPGITEVLTFSPNTSYMYIEGLEITRAAGSGNLNELIALQAGGIHHIIWEHDWFHSTAVDELNKATVIDSTSYTAFVDDFFSDIFCLTKGACTDAHVIGGGTNNNANQVDTTWKVVNSFLEAAGENIILGGGGAAIIPSDIEYRQNYMFKPMTWNPTSPTYDGIARIVKNCFELKTGTRILFEGNICENTWGGYTQPAHQVENSATNQGGHCPICAVTQITERYNYFTTSGLGFGISVRPSGGEIPDPTNNISVHDNVVDNLGDPILYALQNGPTTTFGTAFTAGTNAILHDISYVHNTMVFNSAQTIMTGMLGISGQITNKMSNFNFNNNLSNKVTGDGITNPSAQCGADPPVNCACKMNDPTSLMNSCFSSWALTGNAIVNNGSTVWPGVNCTGEASYDSIFVNYNNGHGGDYHVKPTSSCHNKASDGTDPGANIDLVNQYTKGVNSF